MAIKKLLNHLKNNYRILGHVFLTGRGPFYTSIGNDNENISVTHKYEEEITAH